MSAPVTFSPPPGYFDPMLSFGAALVGFAVASFLAGCMTVQCYLYFSTRNATLDKIWLKVLVATVWSLNFAQPIFQGHYIYRGLIINFGNLKYFSLPSWSNNACSLLGVLNAVLVQMFYARRLYILSKESRVVPGIVVTLSMTAFGFGIALMACIYHGLPFAKYEWVVITWLSFITATDLCISSGMIYQLRTRRTGFESTDKILDRLVILIVNTGVITALTEIACLGGLISAPHNFAHTCFSFFAPILYANSFFGILNARIFVTSYESNVFNGVSSNLSSGAYSKDKVQVHVHSFTTASHELPTFHKPPTDDGNVYRTGV